MSAVNEIAAINNTDRIFIKSILAFYFKLVFEVNK